MVQGISQLRPNHSNTSLFSSTQNLIYPFESKPMTGLGTMLAIICPDIQELELSYKEWSLQNPQATRTSNIIKASISFFFFSLSYSFLMRSFLCLGEPKTSILLATYSNFKSSILVILVWCSSHQNTLLFLEVFLLYFQPCFLSGNFSLQQYKIYEAKTENSVAAYILLNNGDYIEYWWIQSH